MQTFLLDADKNRNSLTSPKILKIRIIRRLNDELPSVRMCDVESSRFGGSYESCTEGGCGFKSKTLSDRRSARL